MQKRLKAIHFIVRNQKKNEGPLRLADDEFGLSRLIIDNT